jgi:signal peptidase I
MLPTLHNEERCLLNRWIFHFRQPRRGDIVVIRDPGDNGYSVKRVVALQGDRIHLDRGPFILNGKPMNEPYLPGPILTYPKPTVNEQEIVCGKNEFVVMGDNRMNSVDSRHYGPISRKRILGLIIR